MRDADTDNRVERLDVLGGRDSGISRLARAVGVQARGRAVTATWTQGKEHARDQVPGSRAPPDVTRAQNRGTGRTYNFFLHQFQPKWGLINPILEKISLDTDSFSVSSPGDGRRMAHPPTHPACRQINWFAGDCGRAPHTDAGQDNGRSAMPARPPHGRPHCAAGGPQNEKRGEACFSPCHVDPVRDSGSAAELHCT
ncbi:hypothetical protein FQR65_LT20032 [Abscondita terminalis]|nr:hypothetical protein FQR65_LT20032 [Abscondita terminalis]